MNKQSIYGLTLEQMTDWTLKQDFKPSRANTLWTQLYRDRVHQFSDMEQDSKAAIAYVSLLQEQFQMTTLEEHVKQESADGTVKFLFRLHDGHLIETVLMRQKYGLSVCVTTQVGCNIGCSFCASGLLSKIRNLTSGEIVEQVIRVQQYLDDRGQGEKVTHLVVMGIGEPFDNYDHLINFLSIIIDHKGLAIGSRRITVSTSGLAPKIKAFADENLRVNLAISLHAPNNELRTSIMKINAAFPLEKLMEAVDYFCEVTNQRVAFEYILLQGVNDQPEHAKELAELMMSRKDVSSVNLIPYNPVDEHIQYGRSLKNDVLGFYDILKKHGINCTIRQEHGTDIDAACGQLRSKQMKREGKAQEKIV